MGKVFWSRGRRSSSLLEFAPRAKGHRVWNTGRRVMLESAESLPKRRCVAGISELFGSLNARSGGR